MAPQKDIEVLMVTGSRIGRTNLDSYGNVAVVESEKLMASGVTTVDDLLRQLPQVTLQGINRNSNNGGAGLAWVDLRNLGSHRTLVLINGKRMVSGGSGVSEAVDFNTIPVSMIERIEILLDGASAIYGSDAVGGVINVLFKKDFEGVEIATNDGVSSRGDGEQVSVSATMGTNYERGNVTVGLSYTHRGEIQQKDRTWSKTPLVDAYINEDGAIEKLYGSSFTQWGRDLSYTGMIFEPQYDANGKLLSTFGPLEGKDRYNYGREQWLSGRMNLLSATALASYDMSRNAELYMETLFTYRSSRQRMAPQPVGSTNSVYSDVGFFVPITNPYIPDDFRLLLPPDADGLVMFRRMADVGRRISYNTSVTYRVVAGARGDFADERFHWDVSLAHGRNRQTDEMHNAINLTRMWESADPALCALNAHRGCVVGDFFGAQLQPEVVDYIRYNDIQFLGYDQLVLDATLSGDIMALPGGMMGFAAGASYRKEYGFTYPSALTTGGDSAGNGLDPTEGDYDVTSGYVEASLPLFAHREGIEELTVDLAARRSNFSSFGSDTTYRVGGAYAPLDQVKLRANLSTAFRAPSISDLYMGSADSYDDVQDPCSSLGSRNDVDPVVRENCAAQGVPLDYSQEATTGSQIRTNIGGNPHLEAETAQALNVGLVLTPTFVQEVKGLSITADYYAIGIDNAITSPTPQVILDQCYGSPGMSNPYCANVGRASNGAVNRLDATAKNIGKVHTSGLDLTLRYDFPLAKIGFSRLGNLGLAWHGNRLISFVETLDSGAEIEYVGTLHENSGSYTKWRWNLYASLRGDNWGVSTTLRYIGGAKRFAALDTVKTLADGTDNPNFGTYYDDAAYRTVASTMYVNINASYAFGDLSVSGGINNLLDRAPPFTLDSGQNANALTYDFVGRYFYTRLAYHL